MIKELFDRITELLAESRSYRLEKRRCSSCDNYKSLLENERRERTKLIEKLLEKNSAQVILDTPIDTIDRTQDFMPLGKKSWIQRRYELEEAARVKAREAIIAGREPEAANE